MKWTNASYILFQVHAYREELMRLEGICDEHENVKSELVKQVDEIRNEIADKEKTIECVILNIITF